MNAVNVAVFGVGYEMLIGKGRNLRVYDAHVQLDRAYGMNQAYILNAIPHIGKLLECRPEGVLNWAQHLAIAQKPSDELSFAIGASGLPYSNLVGQEVKRPTTAPELMARACA